MPKTKSYPIIFCNINIRGIIRKCIFCLLYTSIYFVTLSSEPGHLLDLFHNTMLKESIFRDVQRLDIVGVAQGRMEALRMVEKIVKDKYQETGGFDVTAWFPEEYFTDSEGA